MITKRISIIFVGLLLIIFTTLTVDSALQESLTFDEIVHIEEGKNAIEKQEFLIDTNNPPLIRELAVLPLIISGEIDSEYPNISVLPARLVIVGLGVLLGISIYIVASMYFGFEAGLFALFLYVFEPTILAHSHYVTQDMGATLLFFLAYMMFALALRKPAAKSIVLLGLCIGLMAASKITVVFYFLLSAFGLFILHLRKNVETLWFHKKSIFTAVLLTVIVVWATYFFKTNVIVASGGNTERVSARLMSWAVQNNYKVVEQFINSLHTVQVPLGDYIAVVKNTFVRATRPVPVFFLGEYYPKAEWYFMAANTFFKIPIFLMIVFSIGIITALVDRKKLQTILVFLIPVISILCVSAVVGMQPLVRYVMPLYSFIIIIGASAFSSIKSNLGKMLLLIGCIWYMFSTLLASPHYLSYINGLAGSSLTSYTKFTDSNMDWGQSLVSFKRYIDRVKPSKISFSYFGRDDAAKYGLPSEFHYGSHKFNEICAFHDITFPSNTGSAITAISLSNWHGCGYYLDTKFNKNRILVGGSILVIDNNDN